MGTVALILTSISSIVLQGCLNNGCCKTKLKTTAHINRFNMTSYLVCVLIFGLLLLKEACSVYTVLLGLFFGIITALSAYYKMIALSNGPMHITTLITTSSMLIPTLSGVFFGEAFSLAKLGVAFVLIGFIFLSIPKNNNTQINKKWLISCLLVFVFQGTIGVVQKVHQSSTHKAEVSGFLFVSFICAAIYCLLRNKVFDKSAALSKSTFLIAVVCGGCTFTMNYINLKLSGLLPSQLFFPLINGSAIILSSVAAVILFKEKLSKRQAVGLVGGIVCLIAICLVP